ncbi:hypothetical protein L6R53_20810 [Myxococcota bacterium]|nr:hypothetical protein [Myxococcota bacterium]
MLLLLGWALASAPAGGHAGGPLAGIDAHLRDDGGGVLETSFGLLTRAAGDPGWRWICHEAITTPEATLAPRYVEDAGGVLLGVVPDLAQAGQEGRAVYQSADGGCTWAAVEGLVGQPVTAVAAHSSQPGAWLVAAGARALWTTDGGARWEVAADAGVGGTIGSVAIATDGGAWAAGVDGSGALVLARAPSLEATWSVQLHAAPAGVEGATLSVLAAAGQRAWLAAGATLHDRLWITADGGATVVEAQAMEGDLVDGGIEADGTVWLLETGRAVWRAPDGERFSAVTDWPGVGLQAGDGLARVTAFADLTGSLMVGIDADGAVGHLVGPLDVEGPAACIEGTAGRDTCLPLWATVQANLEAWQPAGSDSGQAPAPEDTGVGGTGAPPAQEPGCGCATGAGPLGPVGAAWLGAVGLARAGRRQKRAPGPGARPPSP